VTLSFEEYVKTAAPVPEPSLAARAGQYLKAHPWRVAGGAAGGLGLGLLGAHLLSKLPGEEKPEPEMGAVPEFAMKGLERGVGGAITEGAKSLGRAAYLGGRRMMQGRRQRQAYEQITDEDPILAQADPSELERSFSTMARFAPTLASDPYAAQSFLREAVTSGGGINYNTLKLLAEAERAAQQV